jgi:hypothetical protein
MNWIPPKVIIGSKATGEYYFNRQNIVDEIWEAIDKGIHILLAAPRRVGKTSVMVHMVENCGEDYRCVFENIQGITSENEFYKRIYELILNCLRQDKKLVTKLGDFLKEINLIEINVKGTAKFGDKKEIDYLNSVNQIIPKLAGTKVVLFLDELPEVLHKLYKNGEKEQASGIIKNLRKWRQEEQFGSLCFVLAGSVGIHHVVKTIEGRTSDLNDHHQVDFEALSTNEADEYVSWATHGATIQYDDILKPYLLKKVSHFIPYFINLMLNEIHSTAKKKRDAKISTDDIDKAFDKIIKQSEYFKDWRNRLFDYFPENVAKFLDYILTYISHGEGISKLKLYDAARAYSLVSECIDLMGDLEKDGYIYEKDDSFYFVSPFLKSYWKRYLLVK